jgi:hypothetical protein
MVGGLFVGFLFNVISRAQDRVFGIVYALMQGDTAGFCELVGFCRGVWKAFVSVNSVLLLRHRRQAVNRSREAREIKY